MMPPKEVIPGIRRSLRSRQSVRAVLCLTLIVPVLVKAQTAVKSAFPLAFDTAYFARASNGAVSVLVDKATGQFWVETQTGVPILFAGGAGGTSFTNVRFQGVTFTNNNLRGPAVPEGTVRMPEGSARPSQDRVVFTAVLRVERDSLELTQEFIPDLVQDFAFVRIRTTLRNLSRSSVSAGFLMMYDLFIGGIDNVDLDVGGARIVRERDWRGDRIPDRFEGEVSGKNIHVRGLLGGAGVDRPDQFVVGSWRYNGYLGAASWDYTPSGLPWQDNAVLMQWNETTIPPGGTMTRTTEYGYLVQYDVDMVCSADSLDVNSSENGYVPDPSLVRAIVRNMGYLAIPLCAVEVSVPPGAVLDTGETVRKTHPNILVHGDSATFAWRFHILPTDTPRVLPFTLHLTDPLAVNRQCGVVVPVPALPRFDASVVCPDTLRLELAPDGKSYTPNPFDIVVVIRNSGTGTLAALAAAISLPPEIQLVTGPAAVPVVPLPLLPGQIGTATWRVQALPQAAALNVSFGVTVTGTHVPAISCSGAVFLPAVKEEEPCLQNGVSARGTEFWTVFPLNSGTGSKSLRLFFAATEQTRVRVERPLLGHSDEFVVTPNSIAAFDIEREMERMVDETVGRFGIRITSDRPISVYEGSLMERHSDASLVLPLSALGTKYVTAGYNYQDTDEHLVVCATQDGTSVSITPFGMTSTRRPARVPFTIALDKGEVYEVVSGILGSFGGLTGSFVEADKPVVVFSGARTGWIPENARSTYGFLNPHFDQIPPIRHLGTMYILVPFLSRFGSDTWKVVSTEDATDVTIGNDPPVHLSQAGDWYEFRLDNPSILTATKPVLLVQFANSAAWDDSLNEYGDGSMVVLPPVDRYASCHLFPSGFLPSSTPASNFGLLLQPGSWIETPDDSLVASSVFTAECWVNFQSGGLIVTRDVSSGSPSDWQLWCDWTNKRLAFITAASPPDEYFYTPDNSIQPDTWYHLALVVNGSAGRAVLYMNGSQALTANFTPRSFDANTGLAWGGYFGNTAGAYLRATIDEARYWNLERTEDEIRRTMWRRLREDERNGLVGYWSFCGSIDDSSTYRRRTFVHGNPQVVPLMGFPQEMNCDGVSGHRSFVNLVVPDGGEGNIALNGSFLPDSAFHRVPGTAFKAAGIEVPAGTTRVETSDPRGVGVVAYGFAYHDAYSFVPDFIMHHTAGTGEKTGPVAPGRLTIAPNPARHAVNITYSLPDDGEAVLVLYDALGRALMRSVIRLDGHASTTFRLDLRGVPAGMYTVLLSGHGFSLAERLMVVP
ncbi:MAG: T9SS type A sorting domain-containing protein [Bacteroidota bacterium]|nr:T9SS type A sorting domain-containing protein [Bacteroidota bacterium]